MRTITRVSFALFSLLLVGRLAADETPVPLTVGFKQKRTLAKGETHVYTAELTKGAAIVAEADQEGIDLVIDVYSPDGKMLNRLDSPNGTEGPEPIQFTALEAGIYRFAIHTLDTNAAAGEYTMKVSAILSPPENARRIAKATYRSATLLKLWDALQTEPKAVDAFVSDQEKKGPLIEKIDDDKDNVLVTYLYPADSDTTGVTTFAGPDVATNKPIALDRFEHTNLFFYSQVVPTDGRYAYSYSVTRTYHAGDVSWTETKGGQLDPFNSAKFGKEAFGLQSFLELQNAPAQPFVVPAQNDSKGAVNQATVHSQVLNEDRTVWVYTPSRASQSTACNLLIVFDGETFGGVSAQTLVPTPTILDNMIAEHKIGPTVCLLVANMGKRNRDLTCNPPFANFVASELIPWARKHYSIRAGANSVATAGSSFGGLCASYCALNHPSSIGNAISLSGSYWVTPDWQQVIKSTIPYKTGEMIEWAKQSPRVPVKLYLEVGRWEGGAWQLGSNREFRDVLSLKGYSLSYEEVNAGHQPVQWQGTLGNGLIYLMGKA